MAVIPSGGGGGGVAGGSGWICIVDLSVPGGVADNKVYQDEAGTILQSCRVSGLDIELALKACYPVVDIGGVLYQLAPAPSGGHYAGTVPLTLVGAGTVTVTTVTPDDTEGASDAIDVTYQAPPELLSLSFTGGYPGTQTQLKAGDAFQLTGTTDVTADAVEIQDFGAMVQEVRTFVAGTTFTVTGTIADRGVAIQSLSARVRARAPSGAYGTIRDTNVGGGGVDGVDLVWLCNLYPTAVWGTPVSYPASQGALKGSEQATVPFSWANADGVVFSSPTGELTISSPVPANPMTVQRLSGSYNVATNNLRAVATRDANAAVTTANTLVKIANVAAQVSIAEPAARLRSGGNDGTTAQDHTITITSNQQLYNAPSVNAAAGAGTWQGSWSGGPSVWTRALRVHDNDPKGAFSWSGLVATNLAGIVTTTITGDSQYVLGGFVARTVTWDAFQTISRNVNVMVVDFAKLQAGLFSATNQQSVKWAIWTAPPKTDGYTISATGVRPHTVTWLDTTAAGSNSGEAYLYSYQEIV